MDLKVKKIVPLIDSDSVEEKIRELGAAISKDYGPKGLHMICVLKGASFFATQLAKCITVPLTIDFMSVSSYGSGTKTSGVVRIIKDLDDHIEGRDVLVVEDIVDTGRTLRYLADLLRDRHPATLRIATLLDKPDRREVELHADYTGFEIPDCFVVGYGLDVDQQYRNLPYIGEVQLEEA